MPEHFDVVIVGAGISGIGAACHLTTRVSRPVVRDPRGPRRRWAARGTCSAIPGVRSDSDMHTLGYSFKPWTHEKSIADGASILAYLSETVDENDVDRHIRFGHHVDARSMVERRRRRGRCAPHDTDDRRTGRDHVLVPASCAPATTRTSSGYTAELARHRALRGQRRAPAALAGRSRLRAASASW